MTKISNSNYDLEERTAIAVPEMKEEARKFWTEANELNLIFNSIYKKVKK